MAVLTPWVTGVIVAGIHYAVANAMLDNIVDGVFDTIAHAITADGRYEC